MAQKRSKGWIDMRKLKSEVSFEFVLAHYGLLENLTRKGDNLAGPCPIHHGTNPTGFHVSLVKGGGVFHCFGDCKGDPTLHDGGGNIFDFVRKMEGIEEPDDTGLHKATYKAARVVEQWIHGSRQEPGDARGEVVEDRPAKEQTPAAASPLEVKEAPATEHQEKPVNLPLKFTLKNLDPEHPYLTTRGLAPETIETFGLGYFSGKGLMAGRVVIPIHNELGELVAYAGRWPGDDPPAGEGKYKLPPNFRKALVVFNLHRAHALAREHGLIVVEGFLDAMNVWQAGFHHVVALMGSTLSEEQEALIVDAVGPRGKVSLMFDEDKAGWDCRDDVLARLARTVYVTVYELGEEGKQPDKMSAEEIRQLVMGGSRLASS